MLYEITDKISEKNDFKINEDTVTVGIISLEQLKENRAELGFNESSVNDCCSTNKSLRNSMVEYNDYCFCIINIIEINNIMGPRDRLGIYFKKNFFLIVDIYDKDSSTNEVFEDVLKEIKPEDFCAEKMFFLIFEKLIFNDGKVLESIEIKLSEMEDAIADNKYDDSFPKKILHTKKRLLYLHNYYEQLYDISMQMEKNETSVSEPHNLRYFRMLAEKVERLSSGVHTLRENIVQLQEAYQSALEYGLNRTMKFFTVIATIFIPLTFIAGWYGMNFKYMPELAWKYGYVYVIVLCVSATIASIIYFKKKNYF